MDFLRNYFYWLLWIAGILCLLIFYIFHKKRMRAFLLGSSTGLILLFLLHFYGETIGFAPTLCTTNLLTCGIFGIPGVALLILTQALL